MAAPSGRSPLGDLRIRGARQHNLKNLDVRLPRHRLVVVTGPSGSGKSSLAFDTLYAEGQRRYLESLSSYARQFLEQVPKPDVDRVEGLSPALAIEQKGLGHNPRSTVGTVTEILPFLRLLYARLGQPHCPDCDAPLAVGHPSRILDDLLALPTGTKAMLMAPLVQGRRGEQRKLLTNLRKRGFVHVRIDGEVQRLEEIEALSKNTRHDLDVVVDRLIVGKTATERLQRSIETALGEGGGRLRLSVVKGEERLYSDRLACPSCGRGFEALEPRHFSFNSPAGACGECKGLGRIERASESRMVPDTSHTIRDGALAPLRGRTQSFLYEQVEHLAAAAGFSLDAPWSELPGKARTLLLDGLEAAGFSSLRDDAQGHERFLADYEGLRPMIERRFRETSSARIRTWCQAFMEEERCPHCEGTRLRPESRGVRLHGRELGELCHLSLSALRPVLNEWSFEGAAHKVGTMLVDEVRSRLGFLVEAGLGYLSLERASDTLSGGEGQRVRLATQVGGRLTGVLYILDEPSIGLHARDTERLIALLCRLRDRGNTVVVVEHDRDIIESADHVLDLGPGAGEHGGFIMAQGTPSAVVAEESSPTGRWLSQQLPDLPPPRRPRSEAWLQVRGITARNLKSVDLSVPVGRLVAITGVSGSGKTTAIHDVLYRALAREYHNATTLPAPHAAVDGTELLSKVVLIDQEPIGRNPRSTPATFTGIFTHLRKLFASTPASKARGFEAGRFSFNTSGGRCESCKGAGVRALTMDFLPEVQVTCDTCRGQRFNRQTLEVAYKGHSIAGYLDKTVEEAMELLANVPPIARSLRTLDAVGLSYLRLGQPADTLSGGEAQRLKLAKELSRPSTGSTLYLLDEPTTGLHFQDVALLLEVLQRLVDKGNTVVVIEHHADVILAADHIIDLGPEGGEAGGEIVVAGPVSEIVECAASHTGAMLRRCLADQP